RRQAARRTSTAARRGSAIPFVDCGRAAIAQVPAPVIARTDDRMPFTVPLSGTRRDRSFPQRALTHATPPRHAGHKTSWFPWFRNFSRGATPASLRRWGGRQQEGASHEEPIDGRGN